MKKIWILGLVFSLILGTVGFGGADDYAKKTTRSFKVTNLILVENEQMVVAIWFPPIEKINRRGRLEYNFHVEIDTTLKALEDPGFVGFVEPKFSINQEDKDYLMSLRIVNAYYRYRANRKSIIRHGFINLSRLTPIVNGRRDPLIDFSKKFTLRCDENSITIKTKPFYDFPSVIW